MLTEVIEIEVILRLLELHNFPIPYAESKSEKKQPVCRDVSCHIFYSIELF